MTKEQILARIKELMAANLDRDTLLREAVRLIHRSSPKYNWTGIYLLEGTELVLHNYIGAPSPHTRIPLDKGICGAAARGRQTVIVPDVNADPRYLACSLETRSEIVVPIIKDGKVYGEIDIDSHTLNAFTAEDKAFLEEVSALLSQSF